MNPVIYLLTDRVERDAVVSVRGQARVVHVTALAARIRILCREARRKVA